MKKKLKIKSLELTIDMLVAVIAEMTVEKAFGKIPIPNYSIDKSYDKSELTIPNYKQNNTGEKITCDDSQPFGFAPIENDFQKGMLEANKELQNICKNIEVDCKCLGQDFIHEIVEFEYNAKSCSQKKCFSCGKITVTHRYNT